MKILYVYSDNPTEWNSSEWRCAIPHKAINKTGKHESKMIHIGDWIKDEENSTWADIIILQRNAFDYYLGLMFYWRTIGKVIIVDLDDAYNYMPPNIASYKLWRNGIHIDKNKKEYKLGYLPIDHLNHATKIANAFTVSCDILKQDWENKANTFVVPNYPDTSIYTKHYLKKIKFNNPINIGWGGSISHFDSFKNSNIVPALKRVQEKIGAKIVLAGGDKRLKILFRSHASQPFPKYLEFPKHVDFYEWPTIIKRFDIGIAPLAGLYDRRRSNIKVLEYMLMGIPVVATNYEPYKEFNDYITLVDNKTTEWEESIMYYARTLDLAAISKAREFALSYDIDLHINEILQTYEKILDEKENLL